MESESMAPVSAEEAADLENADGRFRDLTQKQEAALFMLLSGYSQKSTAATVGVDRKTLYLWIHGDPHFMRLYDSLRARITEQNERQLRELTGAAIDKLYDLLSSNDDSVALEAARIVLRASQKECN